MISSDDHQFRALSTKRVQRWILPMQTSNEKIRSISDPMEEEQKEDIEESLLSNTPLPARYLEC